MNCEHTPGVGDTFVVVESISESLINLRLRVSVAVGCLLNLVLVNLAVTNCVILLVVLDLRNGRVVAVPVNLWCIMRGAVPLVDDAVDDHAKWVMLRDLLRCLADLSRGLASSNASICC